MSVYAEVYKLVKMIPRGRVLTYGLISDFLSKRLSAQGVGWALNALPAPQKGARSRGGKVANQGFNAQNVPWHRVINSNGGISTHKNPGIPPGLQRELLEAEGVTFDSVEKVDLPKFLWREGLGPRTPQSGQAKSEKTLKSRSIQKRRAKSGRLK